MMRFIAILVLIAAPLVGAAQTLKPNGGYAVQWRAMQACLAEAKGNDADRVCVDNALKHCKRAGNFEGCLDSLIQWVASDVDLMQRSLGLKPDAAAQRPRFCAGQGILPGPMCAAQDATGWLLELRDQMRQANMDPNRLETPIFHPRPILDCIDAAPGPAVAMHCVGEGALACWHAENGAGPADTIAQCLDAELNFWTTKMTNLKPPTVMQNDWEKSRTSRCAMVAEGAVKMTGADVMHADCMVQLTGQYVLWLETHR